MIFVANKGPVQTPNSKESGKTICTPGICRELEETSSAGKTSETRLTSIIEMENRKTIQETTCLS